MRHLLFDWKNQIKRVALCMALLPALGLALSSCNHNDEPPSEINLPIIRQYLPVTVQFAADDNEWKV